jgi:hypothetical protein
MESLSTPEPVGASAAATVEAIIPIPKSQPPPMDRGSVV